nr:DUF5696 domain-containing protein [bacterium]
MMERQHKLTRFLLVWALVLVMVAAAFLSVVPKVGATEGDATSGQVATGEGQPADGAQPEEDGKEAENGETEGELVLTYEILQEEFRLVATNDAFEMWYRRRDHNIAIVQKWDNYIWTSFPYDLENDAVAKAMQRNYMRSHVLTTSLSRIGQSDTLCSYADSLRAKITDDRGGLPNAEVSYIYPSDAPEGTDDPAVCEGIRFEYYFPLKRIVVPIEMRLAEEGLRIVVPVNDISEDSDYDTLTELDIAPYFGAGGVDTDGYTLIPDGSGTIIEFNNGKTTAPDYSAPVYDQDKIFEVVRTTYGVETVRLPVFGQRHVDPETGADHGWVGIIEKAAGLGTITASVSGKLNSYNSAHVRFKVRLQDSYSLTDTQGQVLSMVSAREEYLQGGAVQVLYKFLKDDTTYVGMAQSYRDYLMEKCGLEKPESFQDELPFYVELYGTVNKSVPVLGFQTKRNIPLTTYAEAREIVDEMIDVGITQPVVRYMSWTQNAQMGKVMSKVKPASALGGKRQLKKLINYFGENDIPFYPDFDVINVSKSGNGLNLGWHVAKAISGKPARQNVFLYSTLYVNKNYPTWLLMSPRFMEGQLAKLQKSVTSYGMTGISLGALSNTLYSDGSTRHYVTRDLSEEYYVNALQQMVDNNISLMGSASNGYFIGSASHIVDVPTTSSRYFITDYDVPFYQIVLRGYVQYSTLSLNLQSSQHTQFLKALESGSALKYTWIYREGSTLKETPLENLYSVQYKDWIDQAAAYYKEWCDVFADIGNSEIVAHQAYFGGHLTVTTFASGHSIYINYGDGIIAMDSVQLNPGEYAVVKK